MATLRAIVILGMGIMEDTADGPIVLDAERREVEVMGEESSPDTEKMIAVTVKSLHPNCDALMHRYMCRAGYRCCCSKCQRQVQAYLYGFCGCLIHKMLLGSGTLFCFCFCFF